MVLLMHLRCPGELQVTKDRSNYLQLGPKKSNFAFPTILDGSGVPLTGQTALEYTREELGNEVPSSSGHRIVEEGNKDNFLQDEGIEQNCMGRALEESQNTSSPEKCEGSGSKGPSYSQALEQDLFLGVSNMLFSDGEDLSLQILT
ncbi:hypothetical protein H920_02469 [Fukomys damarensis]|uniref:Uncharacterized protein n=1 Tax=Fukomys damarensis TaxID=885580 RepID=A0A091E0L1_FUKDA|nr:hypothetical protein H920_02469 [Fukomys damarensis]